MASLASAACIRAGLDIVTTANLAPDADAQRIPHALTEATEHDACDVLLLAFAPTARRTPIVGLSRAAIPENVPLLLVRTDQPETAAARASVSERCIPSYNDAEVAAQALGAAASVTARHIGSETPPTDEPAGIGRHAPPPSSTTIWPLCREADVCIRLSGRRWWRLSQSAPRWRPRPRPLRTR